MLLGFFLLPAAFILIAPRRWVGAATGWFLLVAGLIAIDSWVSTSSPFDDDGAGGGVGAALVMFAFMVWAISLPIAILIRRKWLLVGEDAAGEPALLQWARCGSVPIAFLIAAAFLHWLSNRIAGASPAFGVHLLVLLPPFTMIALILRSAQWTLVDLKPVVRFALALPAAFGALVLWDVHKGCDMMAKAEVLANGRPWCATTFGGFQHQREATSGWDLSPLVNRRYGNWAVSKAAFLTIASADGPISYRRFNERWVQVSSGYKPTTNPQPADVRPPGASRGGSRSRPGHPPARASSPRCGRGPA